MDADLGGGDGIAVTLGRLGHAQPGDFHIMDQGALSRREDRQGAGQIASHDPVLDRVLGQQHACGTHFQLQQRLEARLMVLPDLQ